MKHFIKASANTNASTAVQTTNKPANLNSALEGYRYAQQFAQKHAYLMNKLKNM